MDDALKGRPTPDLKAVEGRNPPRKWKDPDEAEVKLASILSEEQRFVRKLISPPQAEKLLSDRLYKGLKSLIDFGEKKAILVPEDDSRTALPTIVDEFDD
jgi:hypothetical protein